MDKKIGKTGLIQKEAIFRIITKVLGDRFQPGVDVAPLVNERLGLTDVRPALKQIIDHVYQGLLEGVVPSKFNPHSKSIQPNEAQRIREYANRIAHYWLKHDRRLNGGQSGSRIAKTKHQRLVLESRFKTDPSLKAMRALLNTQSDKAERLEIEKYMATRTLEILFETLEIDIQTIPSSVCLQLGLSSNTNEVKKEAA